MALRSAALRASGCLLLFVLPAGAQWEESEPGCTAVGECTPCTVSQKDEWFCLPTGFSQDVTCLGANARSANTTKTVSCSSSGDGIGRFLTFELLMLIVFAFSFVMTNRRKSRLMSMQHHRIAQYLNT